MQKFKETGDSRYIYQSELDKSCFQHDMAFGDFKDLARRTASDKILHNKAFHITKNWKYDEYQRGLALMVYKLFDKKASGGSVKNENMTNQELAEELHKPIIKKFEKCKVYSSSIGNIWGADLADKHIISEFNKGIRLLLCVVDIFTKYAWVVPLRGKKGIKITNAFQKILDLSYWKPNKIWVGKGNELYNRSMKSW